MVIDSSPTCISKNKYGIIYPKGNIVMEQVKNYEQIRLQSIRTIHKAIRYFSTNGKKYSSYLQGFDCNEFIKALRVAERELNLVINDFELATIITVAEMHQDTMKQVYKEQKREVAKLPFSKEKNEAKGTLARLKNIIDSADLYIKNAIRKIKKYRSILNKEIADGAKELNSNGSKSEDEQT